MVVIVVLAAREAEFLQRERDKAIPAKNKLCGKRTRGLLAKDGSLQGGVWLRHSSSQEGFRSLAPQRGLCFFLLSC